MTEKAKNERLFSLDLLRGLDMMFLTVVAPLLWAIHAVWGLPEGVLFQLTHPWEGFTAWDIIMPMFIFMCGAAIPFALERRLEQNGGKPNAAYWKHVLLRVLMLWVLGMLVQGHLASLDALEVRPYNNTLQTIAFGYLVCAIAITLKSVKLNIAIPVICFIVYGALLHCYGDYSMTGNFAERVEQATLTALLPAGSQAIHEVGELGYLPDITVRGEIHYTWVLTSLMFVFMTYCGYFSTKILQKARRDGDGTSAPPQAALKLAIFGAALLALGWALTFAGVKMVKHIFTVSFTAQAMGWCALLLSLLYLITDVWRFRFGFKLPILFGQFALTAYLMEEFFKPVTVKFAELLTPGFPHLLGTAQYQPLIVALVVVGEIITVLLIRKGLAGRSHHRVEKQ